MQSATSNLGSYSSYLHPQPYMPIPYEPPRKRHLKSPYSLEQETRGSVLRDGSKTSTGSASPIGKSTGYRPASSGSSAAPTEADTLHSTERDSPQQSKWVEWYSMLLNAEFTTISVSIISSSRYDNHSPSTTQTGNGTSSNSERDERNGTDKGKDGNIKNEVSCANKYFC